MTGTVKRPQGAHHNVDLNLFERSVIPWNQVLENSFQKYLGYLVLVNVLLLSANALAFRLEPNLMKVNGENHTRYP